MNRTTLLQQMLKLEERREQLQSKIDKIDKEFAGLGNTVISQRPASRAASLGSSTPPTATKPAADTRKKDSGRRVRGGLKVNILQLLEKAGAEGISVREIAEKLSTTAQNIHSWFNNTGRKETSIRKIAPARYSLAGSAAPATKSESAAPKRAKKAPAPKRGKRARTRRGELREKIMRELEAAGSKGTSVKELSEILGVPYKNVSIWFSTTGQKNSAIEKLGPGKYKLN